MYVYIYAVWCFGTWILFFPFSWEWHHPNWQTPSCLENVGGWSSIAMSSLDPVAPSRLSAFGWFGSSSDCHWCRNTTEDMVFLSGNEDTGWCPSSESLSWCVYIDVLTNSVWYALIAIFRWGYKPTCNWGAPSCSLLWGVPSGIHTKNYGKSPLLVGKSTIKWPFSIAMLVYRRVFISDNRDNYEPTSIMWRFPKMGLPQNWRCILDNSIEMVDFGVPHQPSWHQASKAKGQKPWRTMFVTVEYRRKLPILGIERLLNCSTMGWWGWNSDRLLYV